MVFKYRMSIPETVGFVNRRGLYRTNRGGILKKVHIFSASREALWPDHPALR
jgi:hypothetical protein